MFRVTGEINGRKFRTRTTASNMVDALRDLAGQVQTGGADLKDCNKLVVAVPKTKKAAGITFVKPRENGAEKTGGKSKSSKGK